MKKQKNLSVLADKGNEKHGISRRTKVTKNTVSPVILRYLYVC